MTPEIARERVARGASLLDERMPGWATQINTASLQMANGCFCVLGQLQGQYETAVRDIWPVRGRVMPLRRAVAKQHGFYASGEVGSTYTLYQYRLLQDAWIDAIADRLIPDAQWQRREQPQSEPVTVA